MSRAETIADMFAIAASQQPELPQSAKHALIESGDTSILYVLHAPAFVSGSDAYIAAIVVPWTLNEDAEPLRQATIDVRIRVTSVGTPDWIVTDSDGRVIRNGYTVLARIAP